VDVVRTYLEMTAPGDLRPGRPLPEDCHVARESVDAAAYRHLYALVGRDYHWHDRDAWSDAELTAYLRQPGVSVWVARRGADILGYFELSRDREGGVEIAYFGLAAPAIGHGLGGALLTMATVAAWDLEPARVWLHTCTLDHPAALPNYLARGFRVTRTERYARATGA